MTRPGPNDQGGRMVPGTSLDIPVRVHHKASGAPGDTEDGWFPGFLEHRRQTVDGTWQGYVRYTRGVGQQHVGWFDYEQIQQADPA